MEVEISCAVAGSPAGLLTETEYSREAALGNGLSESNSYLFPTMADLPYHHDWKFAYETDLGLRVHWFGRYAGFPEWKAERSRLASDMIAFLFVETERCWPIVNGVPLELRRGDLLVTKGGDEFENSHDSNHPHVSLSAALALKHGGVTNRLLHYAFKRRYSLKNPQAFVEEFEKVFAALGQEGPFRDLAIGGAIMQWLAFLLQTLRPPLIGTGGDLRNVVDRILAAEAWAMSRLDKVITIDEWSRAVGLNSDYFARIFKRETGKRPMQWLNERRLQMAAQLLGNTRKSVAEVAETCGFANAFYLSRVFKRHFGLAPRHYRRA
jgi:AraC-like DNA-binding protein